MEARPLLGVKLVMRKLNPEPSRRNVHISSPAPVSVPPGYHKIPGAVKRSAPTATSWGWGGAYEIVEKMIGNFLPSCWDFT